MFFILSELLSLSKVSDVSSKVTKKSTFHRSDGIIWTIQSLVIKHDIYAIISQAQFLLPNTEITYLPSRHVLHFILALLVTVMHVFNFMFHPNCPRYTFLYQVLLHGCKYAFTSSFGLPENFNIFILSSFPWSFRVQNWKNLWL